jgi:hypothetical protein
MTTAPDSTSDDGLGVPDHSHRVVFVSGSDLLRIEADPHLTPADVWEVIEA